MKKFLYTCTSFLTILSLVSTSLFVLTMPNSSEAAITDCTTAVGNIVVNCSFETPTGALPSPAYSNTPTQEILDGTYTGITGWSTFDDGGKQGNVGTLHDDLILPAIQGVRFIDVSGHTDSPDYIEKTGMGISQILTGLEIGKTYTVTFSQGYSPILATSQMTVLFDGTPSVEGVGGFIVNGSTTGTTNNGASILGPNTMRWKERTTSFVATAVSMTVSFRSENTGSGRGDFLDNVIIKKVLDTISPTITLSTPSSVVSMPFTVTIVPSEPISGLTLGNIVVTNGTASLLTGPDISGNYTVLITPVAEGLVTIAIPATNAISVSPITDVAGNFNIASTPSPTLDVTYDITPPIFQTVHIQSNNPVNTSYATTGDTVTIAWTVDVGGPNVPVVSNGYSIPFAGLSTISPASCSGSPIRSCSSTIIIGADAPEGLLSFIVSATNNSVTQTQNGSTDGSYVIIDRTPPMVTITSPIGGSVVGLSMIVDGQCEYSPSASTTINISGTNFTPSPTTTTCTPSGTFSVAITNTGLGNPTVTATQSDFAGNMGSDTENYTFAAPTLPVVTIVGPTGVVVGGPNTITGTCTLAAGVVTISGTGFTPPSSTVSCVLGVDPIIGTYTFPITITSGSGTSFDVSQTNGVGTTTVHGSTSPPVIGGGSGGGAVLIDVCNNILDNQFSVPPGLTRDPVTGYCYSTPNTDTTNQQPNTNTNPSSGQGTGNTSVPAICTPYLTSYIKLGAQNDPEQVKKLETFLNEFENANLPVNGVYEDADFIAVKNFQSKYLAHVLSPWGITYATGFVYQTTLAKINTLVCAKNSGCPQFTEYVHAGDAKAEVSKIKSFFNLIRPENNFDTTNTVADSKFVDQVRKFQSRFATFVLGSWDLRGTTGYWYKTTRYQANDFMGCRENPVTLENGKTVGF